MVFLPELLVFVRVLRDAGSKGGLGLPSSRPIRARTDASTGCSFHESTAIKVVVGCVVSEHVVVKSSVFIIVTIPVVLLACFFSALLAGHGLSSDFGLSCAPGRLCWSRNRQGR